MAHAAGLQVEVMFQSLKGFQRLWSSSAFGRSIIHFARFQSLKGFQRLWSSHSSLFRSFACVSVSIPKRVSEALKLPYPFRYSQPQLANGFQSLKGFQRLWSFDDCSAGKSRGKWVSIPKRVSEALKLAKSRFIRRCNWVSIPKRVSEALKQQQ